MVARTPFIAAHEKQAVGDHYMHPTESDEERDRSDAYQGLPHPGPDHTGTVPRLRADTTPAVAAAMGFDRSRPPTRSEVHEVAGGYRADGKPIARSAYGNRWTSRRGANRSDDAKGHRRTDFVDVMLYPHPSWGHAHANAKTPAGAATILAVVNAAADDTMAGVERKMGWTRRGKGGRLGPEPGDLTWIRFLQHTPRPTKTDGSVAPGLHVHNLTPAVVVTESGHVGAMDTNRKRGLTLGDDFNLALEFRGKEAGIAVEMRNGVAVLSDVPQGVVDRFATRTEEAIRNAQDWVAKKEGKDLSELPPERQSAIIHAGARATQGGPRDGMADRAKWRAEYAAMGWPPVDVARPARAVSSVPAVGTVLRPEGMTLLQEAAAYASQAGRTALMATLVKEQAPDGSMPDLRRQAEVVWAVEALGKALEPASRLREASAFARAAKATAALSGRMAGAIRQGWVRHRENREARLAAAPLHDFHRENELLREARELARQSGVTARMAGEKRASGAIRDTMESIRIGRAVDAVAARPKAVAEAPRAGRKPIAAATAQPAKFRTVVSLVEAERQLREALKSHKLKPGGEELIFDGRMHYLPVEGNRGRERSGAYRAHHDENGAAAAIYNWKAAGNESGFVDTWKADGEVKRVSPADAAKAEEARAKQAIQREREEVARHARAAVKARRIYGRAKEGTAAGHPYLARKGLAPVDGLRVDSKGRLLVPMRVVDGKAHVNTQTIGADGTKKYAWEAKKQGAFFVAGAIKFGQPIVVAEGVATAIRLHQATGLGVVAAFDSGNLLPVAKAISAAIPGRPLVFAADNDDHLPKRPGDRARPNEGIVKATKAAEEVGNARVWPPPSLPEREAKLAGTDWDDFGHLRGDKAIAAAWAAFQAGQTEGAKVAPARVQGAPGAAQNPWDRLRERGAAIAPKETAAPTESAGQRMG